MITHKIRPVPSRAGFLVAAAFALGLVTSHPARAKEPPMAAAGAALQSGDLTAAESLLAPLAEAAQPDPGALALLAQVRLAQHRAADAIDLLKRALARDAKNARLHAALGVAISKRMPDAAVDEQGALAAGMLEAFQTAITIDPNLIDARVGLARYYTNAPEIAGGSRPRAEEQARFIAQRMPWLGEAELGQIALKFGDPASARDHLARADELNPGQAWLLELRGHAAVGLKEFDQARAHYEAALAINPHAEAARQALTRLPAKSG